MINMQSWMFLSSFESLRRKIIDTQHIDSLLHLGPRTFDELSGEVVQNAAFVISKTAPNTSEGIYYRLIDGKSCAAKRDIFLANENRYVVADQKQFEQIPGNVFGYWVSDTFFTIVQGQKSNSILTARHGILTGNDEKYIRYWYEPNIRDVCFNAQSFSDIESKDVAFYPMNKGGAKRKWYGNNNTVIWIKGNLDKFNNNKLAERNLFFREGITWTEIADRAAFRYSKLGILFGHKGATAFFGNKEDLIIYLGYANSNIFDIIKHLLFTGLSFTAGNLQDMPFSRITSEIIVQLVLDCVSISKQDWDAHETSWDFQCNELVALSSKEEGISNIESAVEAYEKKWTDLFFRLYANEEELNRQFIEIYGLQDELTPDVPLEEVTILQQGEIKISDQYRLTTEDDKYIVDEKGRYLIVTGEKYLDWQRDIIIKQLISYIVGVWMGRYRLNKPGLHIAHPNQTEDELAEYSFSITGNQTLKIDVDGIIPILPSDAPFFDNLRNYVVEFVRKVWGDDSLTENINFMEKCLGKSLDDFLMKDFWKYHKKMYQNRPIYWEFASKKGAFRALIYAHRMDRYTVEVLRSKYLLPYIGHIERKIAALELRQNELTTSERRELDNLRNKILPELREYHDRVEKVAAETAARSTVFDLDDGIIHNHALFGDIVTKLK